MTTVSRTISRSVSYIIVSATAAANGAASGNLTLIYHPTDPHAVRMFFGFDARGRVEWPAARDLIREGLTGLAGLHDVCCWTEGVWYYIALSSPEGRVVLKLLAEYVRMFLAETATVVPYGTEQVDVDAMLAGLLGGAR